MKNYLGVLAASLLLVSCAAPDRPGLRQQGSAAHRLVSIVIIRHAETDTSQPTLPLTPDGRLRAERLTETVRGVRFSHFFASHTTRSRQMLEGIAAAHQLPIVQLPTPGSVLEGKVVDDQTSRRAPIEPMAQALLQLPAGSVAIVALNSENIYAILNRLGVPQAAPGQTCVSGSACVPCTDNTCYPRNDFDHLWHLVVEPGRPEPLTFLELRYAAGWKAGPR